jgi:uncharacterized membrane protein
MPNKELSFGQRMADKLASAMGSWKFLIIQTLLLLIWVVSNLVLSRPFDVYPFVFLNLLLSFQAAYSAPIIMMSSNRKEQIDRSRSIKLFKLETEDNERLKLMMDHIDQHFHSLNRRIDQLEKNQSQDL